MKVLVALHKVMDLGGIINHTEQLIGGLKDEGHEVAFKEFAWTDSVRSSDREGNWLVGPSGIPHDQGKGWLFKGRDRIGYRGARAMQEAKRFLEGFDVVIWTIPVPSANAHNLKNMDWPSLYDLPPHVKQIAFIHDGNPERGYPHILRIEEHLAGVACVHHCALNSSAFMTVPRALILNPQEMPVRDPLFSWDEKLEGFVNMQTFKAWKHVHELVESIAYMPPVHNMENRYVAGDGIEARYMRSEDKCKPAYYHSSGPAEGLRFWEAALNNGMIAPGYWSNEEVEQKLQLARVLVDPSWSSRYSLKGGHYNRVTVDAMIRGCVVVGRERGLGTDLFKPGENYVEIPENAGPQEYADIILEAGNAGPLFGKRYREANVPLLALFDRRTVAKQVIALAFGQLDGFRKEEVTPKSIIKKSDDIMFNHFGVL